jgi:transcriptional regulator with XRE-family HTH domain
MQDALDQLREFMSEKGLSQAELAKKARISQATVSRILSGKKAERDGGARRRLFIYVEKELGLPLLDSGGRERVVRAFDEIWDGSEAHAFAVARIIDALAGLRPSEDEEG